MRKLVHSLQEFSIPLIAGVTFAMFWRTSAQRAITVLFTRRFIASAPSSAIMPPAMPMHTQAGITISRCTSWSMTSLWLCSLASQPKKSLKPAYPTAL